MTNAVDPGFNIDDVHRDVVGELFDENGLGGSAEERRAISARWHLAAALRRLRQRRICVSFTPVAYRRPVAFLAVEPGEILMVACHNFDLDAARGVGYRTAFVRRPSEWGAAGPPDPVPNPATDIVVDGFAELADRFGG
jgi:2-haloacid dehalogenase